MRGDENPTSGQRRLEVGLRGKGVLMAFPTIRSFGKRTNTRSLDSARLARNNKV
jgi:hypothetical protein